MSAPEEEETIKLVVQQCLSARLKPPPGSKEEDDNLSISAGMVVFVCFLRGATEEAAIRAAETVTKVKLCEPEGGDDGGSEGKTSGKKRTTVLDKPGDLLIVPQATLGGKLKGKASIQYHGNVDKADGERLFAAFCETLRSLFRNHPKTSERGCRVRSGVYGARQVLAADTNGPYTHTFSLK
jgi:D-tyrosyl-tRNA(Tyr) deacylase